MTLKNRSILVVDDETAIQESLNHTLSDHACHVTQCRQPLKAIEVIEKNHFDLMLLDIWMPDLDGVELLKQVKQVFPQLPVIIISGHANVQGNFELAKIGADDFLEKPFSTDSLLWKIEKILSQGDVPNQVRQMRNSLKRMTTPDGRSQKTLKQSQVVKGKGLHSGQMTGMIISPLPADSGIIFEDITTGVKIEANWQNVYSTSFATQLKREDAEVSVVEHLLSAFHLYQIDNALVKVNKEIPILDGSSLEFCQLFDKCGFKLEMEKASCIEISKEITYVDPDEPDKWIKIEPFDGLYIDYMFELPKFGEQTYTRDLTHNRIETYREEIAPARTFGFMNELKHLQSVGLGRGGDLSNFLLVDDDKVVNLDLRFPDEFARHKVLDIFGDFYLLGKSIKGKITGRKTGHRHNIGLIKKIVESL